MPALNSVARNVTIHDFYRFPAVLFAMAPLRDDNVLIIGSGSFTHNLRLLRREPVDGAQPPDVAAFGDWFDAALSEGRTEDLLRSIIGYGTRPQRPRRWQHERSCCSISKAEGLRASGLCLIEPSTLAISVWSGKA